jgi:hypothetical protein
VVTDQDFIQGQGFQQGVVDGFDDFPCLLTPGHIRLIGDSDKQETGFLQSLKGCGNIFGDLHLFPGRGRVGLALPDDGPVEHSVAVQENRLPPATGFAGKI